MRVLVFGGRTLDHNKVTEHLRFLLGDGASVECIIEGEATGADTGAALYAEECQIPLVAFPADWSRYGKAAGHIRNKQMIDEGKPDYAIAFPGGKGTANMVKQLMGKNIPVHFVKENINGI